LSPFQFNDVLNDTLERPSRVSFIKLSEESNESCQGIVIQHVFPQAITIAEERTIFLPATSVKKCPWKDSVVSSQCMLILNTTTEVELESMDISFPLVSIISAQENVSSIRPKMVEAKSYAVKINKTKVVINGGTRGQNHSAKRRRWPMNRKDGPN